MKCHELELTTLIRQTISFEVRLLAVVVEAADSDELRIPRIILHCVVTQASFFYFSVKMNS